MAVGIFVMVSSAKSAERAEQAALLEWLNEDPQLPYIRKLEEEAEYTRQRALMDQNALLEE